jgi:hypothetical protein
MESILPFLFVTLSNQVSTAVKMDAKSLQFFFNSSAMGAKSLQFLFEVQQWMQIPSIFL